MFLFHAYLKHLSFLRSKTKFASWIQSIIEKDWRYTGTRGYLLAKSWPSFVSEDRFRQMARERVIMAAHVWESRARNHWTPIAVWPLTNIDIRGTFRVRTTYRLSRVNWVNWIAPCRGHVENAPGIQSTNCRLRAIHSSCAEEILLVEDFWLVFSLKFFFREFFLTIDWNFMDNNGVEIVEMKE